MITYYELPTNPDYRRRKHRLSYNDESARDVSGSVAGDIMTAKYTAVAFIVGYATTGYTVVTGKITTTKQYTFPTQNETADIRNGNQSSHGYM